MVKQSPFIEVSSEFQPELTDIQRKQRLAQLLMERGMQTPQGQMVSGRYVAPSWSQNLANLFSVYSGKNLEQETEARQQALAQKLRQAEARDLQSFMEAGRAAPEQTVYGVGAEGPTMTVTPEVKPDYRKQLAIALGSQSPTVRALGTEMLKQSMTPQKVGADESLVVRDIFGGGGYSPIATGAPKLGQELRDAARQARLDITKVDQWTDADWARVRDIEARIAAGKRPVTNVMVNTEKSYGQQFGQKLADTDVNLYQSAQKAPEMLANVERTKKLLDDKNVITGFGAQQRLDLARLGSALNIGGKDTKETVANTQQLFANRAQATLDAIRDSGLGAGQGFSNKDREFLEAAKLGNITYDKTTLKRQLDIEENVARATANKWNTRIKNIPQSATGPTGVGPVFITQPNPPAGNIDVRSEADRILQGR